MVDRAPYTEHELRAAQPAAINHTPARDGRSCAVCVCCGRRSRPARCEPGRSEPDLWNMARGWSQAPYPAGTVHRDGSTGSIYTCPDCNLRLRRGESLTLRNTRRTSA